MNTDDLRDIALGRKGTPQNNIYVMKGPKGTFDVFDDLFETHWNGQNIDQSTQFRQELFNITVKMFMRQNKREDKVQIQSYPYLRRDQQDLFNTKNRAIPDLVNRLRVMVACTMVAQFEGATLHIYHRRQQAADRLATVTHDDIYQWLHPKMAFTGDFEQDYNRAFNELWFNFHTDLTEQDNEIKRITLMHYSFLTN